LHVPPLRGFTPPFSLPPQQLCRGEFDLGVVQYEQPKWHVGLRHGGLPQKLAIQGRSGAGKTNVVVRLLRERRSANCC